MMKMRRLELAILALTLAFAFFMGGFFTGRGTGSVSIVAAQPDGFGTQVSVSQPATAEQSPQEATPAGHVAANPNIPVEDRSAQQESASPSQATGAPRDGDGRININTAGAGELTDLPGVGDAIAARIIDYRTQNGEFLNIEDIKNVSGIGEKRFEAIKDLITVG